MVGKLLDGFGVSFYINIWLFMDLVCKLKTELKDSKVGEEIKVKIFQHPYLTHVLSVFLFLSMMKIAWSLREIV